MFTHVDHIELVVKDVKAHADLFQKMGFNLLSFTPHHGGSAELQLPGPNQPLFEIHSVGGEENIGVNHIAFGVDDVNEACEELKAAGVQFDREPHLVRASGRTIANFRDPDGWRLQLVDPKRAAPSE